MSAPEKTIRLSLLQLTAAAWGLGLKSSADAQADRRDRGEQSAAGWMLGFAISY